MTLPGLCMYPLTILIACDKSGLVHAIVYIKLPTALAYITWDIYSCFSTDFGEIVALSLKWGVNGVLANFVSPFILNFCSTFYKYPFCIKRTLPLFRSLSIFMLSTFFTSLRSFISNSEDNCFFKLLIADLLLEAMSISSTYSNK